MLKLELEMDSSYKYLSKLSWQYEKDILQLKKELKEAENKISILDS